MGRLVFGMAHGSITLYCWPNYHVVIIIVVFIRDAIVYRIPANNFLRYCININTLNMCVQTLFYFK